PEAGARQRCGGPFSDLGANDARRDRLHNQDLAGVDGEIARLVDRSTQELRHAWRAGSNRDTHSCASTSSAATESRCAARRRRHSMTARLPSPRMGGCPLPRSAPSGCWHCGTLELIFGYLVPGWWGLYWDRLNGSPLRISTRKAVPDVGEAQIWCELGIFFGSTMVHVTASGSTDTAPPSRPGRKPGDIEFNTDPQAGGHVGWVWVVPTGSTAGSWRQFG